MKRALIITGIYGLCAPILGALPYLFETEIEWTFSLVTTIWEFGITYYSIPYVIKYNNTLGRLGTLSKLRNANKTSNTNNNNNINNGNTRPRSVLSISSTSSSSLQTEDKNETMLANIADWSKLVTTALGYEQFINHLESEFSVENLLLITEYMQVKHVLKKRFVIFNKLWKNNESIRFNIDLPEMPDSAFEETSSHTNTKTKTNINININTNNSTRGSTFNSNHKNGISIEINDGNNGNGGNKQTKNFRLSSLSPSDSHEATPSTMGLQLNNIHIIELPPIMPVSLIAKKLYNDLDIIEAFKSLYKKYIDSKYAPFMINISATSRYNLKVSLDHDYYIESIYSHNKNKSTSVSLDRLYFAWQLARDRVNNTSDTNDRNDRNNNNNAYDANSSNCPDIEIVDIAVGDPSDNTCIIDEEFKQHQRCVEWLLIRLITEMDAAAQEVSDLMNQSFIRFKKQHNAL